jgi:hypothetical protein
MNTFSTRFAASAAKQRAKQQADLRAEIEHYLAHHVGEEFTFEDFASTFQPANYDLLGIILGELVQAGRLKQIIRVYSHHVPGGGIGDFDSFKKIPPQIADPRAGGINMEVTGEDIRVIYKVLR